MDQARPVIFVETYAGLLEFPVLPGCGSAVDRSFPNGTEQTSINVKDMVLEGNDI